MKRFLTLLLILVTVCSYAAMRGGSQYDPGAARSNLSNVDATATPSMTSITLSDKIRAAWADILGDIYASGTAKVAAGTAAAPAYSFASDPDTGIYSAGAGLINISRGGNPTLQIGSAIDFYDISGGDRVNIYPQAAGNGVNVSSINNDATVYRPLTVYCATASFPVGNVLIATTTDDGANKLQVNGSVKFDVGSSIFAVKEITLADDDAVSLRTLFGVLNYMRGTVRCVSVDDGASGDFLILGASDISILAVNFAVSANTDSDGNLCVFPEPGATHDYILKNRLGGTRTIIVVYQGVQ